MKYEPLKHPIAEKNEEKKRKVKLVMVVSSSIVVAIPRAFPTITEGFFLSFLDRVSYFLLERNRPAHSSPRSSFLESLVPSGLQLS